MRRPLDSNFKIKVAVIALCLVVAILIVWVQGYTSHCLPIIFVFLCNWMMHQEQMCSKTLIFKTPEKPMSLPFVSKTVTPPCRSCDFASFTFFITKPKSSCGHLGTLLLLETRYCQHCNCRKTLSLDIFRTVLLFTFASLVEYSLE